MGEKYDAYLIFDQKKEQRLRNEGKTLVLGDPERYNQERLFLPESSQEIIATYSSEKIYSAYGIMVGTKKNNEYDLKFICALLNSNLITFYCIEKEILRKGNKATPHVGVKGLNSIPIPLPNDLDQKQFVQLVDKILSITKSDDYLYNAEKQMEVKMLEEEIDRLVYQLYELTPEEIKIVEEFNSEKRQTPTEELSGNDVKINSRAMILRDKKLTTKYFLLHPVHNISDRYRIATCCALQQQKPLQTTDPEQAI